MELGVVHESQLADSLFYLIMRRQQAHAIRIRPVLGNKESLKLRPIAAVSNIYSETIRGQKMNRIRVKRGLLPPIRFFYVNLILGQL